MTPRLAAAAAALVAAATVLAGCVSIPENATTAGFLPEAATPGTAGLFHGVDGTLLPVDPAQQAQGAQYSIGADAFEPTLGITSDGAIYMTGYNRGPTIFRSADQGQTWTDVGPKLPDGRANPPITNDPYAYVDPATDRVFTLDLLGTVCSYLSWSDDAGASWTTNPLACGTPLVNDHQTIVAAKPRALPTVGYPSVLYYCVNRVVDSACATSLDGGRTFGPLRPAVYLGASPEHGRTCGGLHGHVKAAPDGTVYLARGYCGTAVVAVTKDDGLTWSKHVIDTEHPVEGHEISIAIDEEGGVYALWTSKGLPYYSYSTDGGQTWAPAKLVSAPGVTATMFGAVVAAGPGRIAFAYVGSTVEGGYEGKDTGNGGLMGDILGQPRPKEWEGVTWNAYIGVMTGANTETPVIQTVTANDPADPVARGLCGRTRCNGMTDFIDIDVDHEGRPWASFVDVCTKECVSDPAVWSDESVGFVGTLVRGPSLLASGGMLRELLPPPVAAAK